MISALTAGREAGRRHLELEGSLSTVTTLLRKGKVCVLRVCYRLHPASRIADRVPAGLRKLEVLLSSNSAAEAAAAAAVRVTASLTVAHRQRSTSWNLTREIDIQGCHRIRSQVMNYMPA